MPAPSQSLCFVQPQHCPCAVSAACSSGLDAAAGSTCTARAAISWPDTAAFQQPSLPQTGCSCVPAARKRKSFCKWCVVLLRVCCIIFAAQGRNIPRNPSVFSGLSIKSPALPVSSLFISPLLLRARIAAVCLPFCHSLQPSWNPPFFPGKRQPPPRRQSCQCAFPLQCCYKPCLIQSWPRQKGTKP